MEFFNNISQKESEINEVNEIHNSSLVTYLSNSSVSLLMQYNQITNNDLNNFKIEFGYLFRTKSNEIEALIKCTTNNKINYIAAQHGNLMLLNFNEELYNNTISQMKGLHPCINDNNTNEKDIQKERKIKNNNILTSMGISINDNLINSSSTELTKNLDDVCKRAIACLLVIQIACDINNGNYKSSLNFFSPMLDKYNVRNNLNSKEKRIIDGTYNPQDAADMDWAYEAYWSLCWALGLIDSINDASNMCDCELAIRFVNECASYDEFKNKCKLRSLEEILDMQDLYLRYNWAINNKQVNINTNIGNLDPDVVIERRRGLEWLLSDKEDWYDIIMNT